MASTISSSNSHKLQRYHMVDMKDMISDLPEGILYYILSRLSTEEAVRTSILATKWRYLWTQLPVFDFRDSSPKRNSKSPDCLVDLVDQLLHKSNRIKKLFIELPVTIVDAGKVSSMLSSALMHDVHDLTLNLESENSRFVLPNSFSASRSLTKLDIVFGFLDSVPDGICFPSLKILSFAHVAFTNEKSAQRLFSGCPVLQDLSFEKCYWVNINISVAIPTLKKLDIFFRSSSLDRNSCMFKIDAVNLLSLSYKSNPTINCFLVNSTSIVDANIDLGFFCVQNNELHVAVFAIELFSRLGSVESLRLSDQTIQCLNYAKSALHLLPSFKNLTRLEVHFDDPSCEVLADILRKSPKLEFLHIYGGSYLSLDSEDWTSDSLPCCFKSSLKSCDISDFRGDEAEIRLVKFLLENVTLLREMNIYCTGYLSKKSKKLADVRNQLQALGMGSCVINLHHSWF